MTFKERIKEELGSRFAKDTLWLMAAQAVLMISGLGINLIIGKIRGADDLGIFSQAMAFYTILSTLFAVGLNNTITKKISEGGQSTSTIQEILTSNLLITSVVSCISSAVVIIMAKSLPGAFSSPELAQVIHIPMLALPFFNVNKNFGAYFTGLRLQKRFAQQRIIRWSIIFAYILYSVYTEQSVENTLWCFLAAESSVLLINLLQFSSRLNFRIRKATLSENLRFGMRTYVAELISVLNSSLDVILIGYFLSNSETGIYSFIVYFAKTLFIFPGIMMQNFSPIVSKTWAGAQLDELKTRMRKIRRTNSVVVSLQLVGLLIFYPLITLLIKQEFAGTFLLMLITVIGAYIFSLISWSGSMLIMTNKLRENINRTTLIILLSAISSITFTYFLGLTGACIAFSLNGIISFLTARSFIKRTLQLRVI
jgi:O-antigen/teichoic acid export membrane protein